MGDATGYEIKKMVAEGSFSFFSEASFGSIYPALTKLTDEGFITCRSETQSNRPDKKIYSLTKLGVKELEGTLEKSPKPDKNRSEFLAALLFAEAISPNRIQNLVDERIEYHANQIKVLEDLLSEKPTGASKFVIEYGLEMQRAAAKFLQENSKSLTD
ncbi:PadR family transcriptional regulator [Kordiimonas sp. SCSIO 12610]|nr:PadR family transcriptional regulator [Kordiimonas sp. SCSIO 12610]